MKKPANQLTATEAVTLIGEGKLTAEKLVRDCIERIDAREKDVGAWAYFNEAQAIAQARACDQNPSRGLLHGIPVGVKDIIDTVDMPTEYGTPIYAGNQPPWDAACVNAVRHAGGIILGKTVTTELAYFGPGKTRNPLKLNHTPGGSSSGSAAAVADCMVPLAFGTQTGGSTLRPAAFCGIVGFKPTFNLVNRAGVKPEAESLDTIGIMTRCVADAALFTAAVTDRFYLRHVRPLDGTL
ncbi:MAG: amidase, partial [Burkholderiales bacterium]